MAAGQAADQVAGMDVAGLYMESDVVGTAVAVGEEDIAHL